MRGPVAVFDGFLGRIVASVSRLRINTKYRVAVQQSAESWLVARLDTENSQIGTCPVTAFTGT
jgi:hypothetical protein